MLCVLPSPPCTHTCAHAHQHVFLTRTHTRAHIMHNVGTVCTQVKHTCTPLHACAYVAHATLTHAHSSRNNAGGYFEDVLNGRCSTCDAVCLTCDGNGTSLQPGTCLSCSAFTLQHANGTANANASSLSSECVMSCPTGMYGDHNLACMLCDSECGASGCFGPGPSACGAPSRALDARTDCTHAARGRTCVAGCNNSSEFLHSVTNPVREYDPLSSLFFSCFGVVEQ